MQDCEKEIYWEPWESEQVFKYWVTKLCSLISLEFEELKIMSEYEAQSDHDN